MYRTCDLVSIDDETKTARANISEKNAVEGLGIQLSNLPGRWKIKRVHGYSLFQD